MIKAMVIIHDDAMLADLGQKSLASLHQEAILFICVVHYYTIPWALHKRTQSCRREYMTLEPMVY